MHPEFAECLDGLRVARAAAGNRDRPVCVANRVRRRLDRFGRGDRTNVVHFARRILFGHVRRFEHVGRDVDQHRTRTPAARERERFTHFGVELTRIRDEDRGFGRALRDRADVGFLKTVGAHQRHAHVGRDRHDRNRIHHRIDEPGDEIGRPRSRGCAANADASAGPCITTRRKRRARLMANEDVTHGMSVERIVKRHDGAAGVAENNVDPLAFECFKDRVSARSRARRHCGVHFAIAGALSVWNHGISVRSFAPTASIGCLAAADL